MGGNQHHIFSGTAGLFVEQTRLPYEVLLVVLRARIVILALLSTALRAAVHSACHMCGTVNPSRSKTSEWVEISTIFSVVQQVYS
jgi:hypothetical protein